MPTFANAWAVYSLFLIPIGGGIPAGVVLAQSKQIAWPWMMALYFVSDVTLAFIFEPVLMVFAFLAKRSPFLTAWAAAMKVAMDRTVSRYGANPGPFTLVMISFGVDPMTGRTAAKAAGHRFISGWAIAIAGDMIFFSVIMVSTLWLNNVLGNGTWTAVIILVAMLVIPKLLARLRPSRYSTPHSHK